MTKKSAGRRNRQKRHDHQYDQFVEQLKAQGLVIQPIAADGDCMFAAIADQLNLIQDKKKYVKAEIREQTVNYIFENGHEFSAFLVDETVENYCCAMRKQGRWGGHMELQAAVHVYRCNIVIHQYDRARFILRHPDYRVSTAIHLSYHDGEHYASCRPMSGQHKPVLDTSISEQYKSVPESADYAKSNGKCLPNIDEDDGDEISVNASSEVDKQSRNNAGAKKEEKGRRMTKKERKILKKQKKMKILWKSASDKNCDLNKEIDDKIAEIVERLGTVLI